MSKIIAAIVFALSQIMQTGAETTVYRLELTDETPYVVGGDGVRRQVVIVDPDEYEMLTGRVEKVWAGLNSTEDGRIRLHGKRVDQFPTNAVKVTVYADGYRHLERMVVKAPARPVVRNVKKTPQEPRKPFGISDRQWKFRQRRKEALSGKAKEVSVEHDAVAGKDIVK